MEIMAILWIRIASAIFNSTSMSSLRDEGKDSSSTSFVDLTPAFCTSQERGSYTFQVERACKDVIKTLHQTGTCFWIPGCECSSFQPNRESACPKRAIYMKEGRIIKATRQDISSLAFSYSVPSGGDELSGCISTVLLRDGRRGSCSVMEQFSMLRSGELSASHVLEDLKSKLPGIEKLSCIPISPSSVADANASRLPWREEVLPR
jgi:hypothetical protein